MTEPELVRFIRGEMDPRAFPHSEHVRMGFEMLRRHPFAESALHYSAALRAMTASIGKPEAFHQTVTIAFLALIAERLAHGSSGLAQGSSGLAHEGHADFGEFATANPDLMQKSVLRRWYSPERLASEAARTTFLLPDLGGGT